ncbi:MAG: coenzyme F420-0:L-glutamate ligase [Anaerolineae bacterium]
MKLPQITITAVPNIPLIQEGDDLPAIILDRMEMAGLGLQDGDVLVIAQKIVSKAEGRLVHLDTVRPSPPAQEIAEQTGKDPRLVEVILSDTREISRMRKGLLIVENNLGLISANAGVDRSNVAPPEERRSGGAEERRSRGDSHLCTPAPLHPRSEWVAQLPVDPDASARVIRRRLMAASGKEVAVIINDTHGRPWRIGAVGVAIGVAGIEPVEDLRGQPDLFGHTLETTQVGLADQVAAAASLIMGQADEGRPVVLLRGLAYTLKDDVSSRELLRPKEQDLYR